MKRNNPKDDIAVSAEISEVWLIDTLAALTDNQLLKRAPSKKFPDWDWVWTSKIAAELKEDFLNIFTENIAIEKKCLLNSKAEDWYYSVPHLCMSEKDNLAIIDIYRRMRTLAARGDIKQVRSMRKEIATIIKRNLGELRVNIYRWDISVLTDFASSYRLVKAGDNGRALCHIVPKVDISNKNLLKTLTLNDIDKNYIAVIKSKWAQELNYRLRIAKEKGAVCR